jgi:DNA-directed RNA polymerase subunit RPC12/RpoP
MKLRCKKCKTNVKINTGWKDGEWLCPYCGEKKTEVTKCK